MQKVVPWIIEIQRCAASASSDEEAWQHECPVWLVLEHAIMQELQAYKFRMWSPPESKTRSIFSVRWHPGKVGFSNIPDF